VGLPIALGCVRSHRPAYSYPDPHQLEGRLHVRAVPAGEFPGAATPEPPEQPARLPVADSEYDYFKKEADQPNVHTREREEDGT